MNKSSLEIMVNKVLDSSSNIIWNEMKKMRESSEKDKQKIRRRWIWELIQNASDCTPQDKKIDIKLSYSNNKVKFSHNGSPFSYKNLLDLITQISSKQSSKEEKAGKFGTGFISTHLLSEKVRIKGSFYHDDNKYADLDFSINRTGKEYNEIRENTQKMLEDLNFLNENINSEELSKSYKDTMFIYSIKEDFELQKEIEQTIYDFEEMISYILVFNKNINTITYNNNVHQIIENKESSDEQKMKIVQIRNDDSTEKILVLREGSVAIACNIDFDDSRLYFLPISNRIPKIFCRFPLIGTEEFSFPIIVNSDALEVESDRDAIRDNNDNNLKLMKRAINLYIDLIDFCVANENTRDEYNICFINQPNPSRIQEYCYEEIKSYIEKAPIIPINIENGILKRLALRNGKDKLQVRIPSTEDIANSDLLWNLMEDYKGVNIPTIDTYKGWSKVFTSHITFSIINDRLLKDSTLKENSDYLENMDVTKWLNLFYNTWIKENTLSTVIKYVVVPNQQGDMVPINKVNLDKDIDIELKEILNLLTESLLETLLIKEIDAFDEYFKENPQKIINDKLISESIELEISNILLLENIDSLERDKDKQDIFNKLTNWFIENKKNGENWFPSLYPKRMMLSTAEENLRRYKIAEKIEANNIEYDELDRFFQNYDKMIEIMGNKELSSENIIAELSHIVKPSKDLKLYVERLIDRSIKNVYSYLSTNPRYKVPLTLDQWIEVKYSKTIFPAEYDDKEIRVVIRPSDNQQIIFYYEEELEALDDTDYQLWSDDGNTQRMITLGDLLKTTGISKIPLRKI